MDEFIQYPSSQEGASKQGGISPEEMGDFLSLVGRRGENEGTYPAGFSGLPIELRIEVVGGDFDDRVDGISPFPVGQDGKVLLPTALTNRLVRAFGLDETVKYFG